MLPRRYNHCEHTHGCVRREMASSTGSARNKFSPPMKSFCASGEDGRKWAIANMTAVIKQRSSIMLAFFTMLYRGYCRARLAEMRKFQLTHPGSGN
jgi:hypothetical protein